MSTLFHLNRNCRTSPLQQQISGQLVDVIWGDYLRQNKSLPSNRNFTKSLKMKLP